jgi:DNA-binding response OmpR family regulator
VLLIEDHDDTRHALEQFLDACGYDVVPAENGIEGLDLLVRGASCCVVVLDWRLPGLHGGEVLGALLADDAFCRLPVVIASGDGVRSGDVHSPNVRAVLQKPLDLDEMLAVLEREAAGCEAWRAAAS